MGGKILLKIQIQYRMAQIYKHIGRLKEYKR